MTITDEPTGQFRGDDAQEWTDEKHHTLTAPSSGGILALRHSPERSSL